MIQKHFYNILIQVNLQNSGKNRNLTRCILLDIKAFFYFRYG